jgi:hypothetical protein
MRWIPWFMFVVGLWLTAAPFALGYSGTFQAATNDVGLGVLIAASSLWIALTADAPGWLDWALMLFGVWAIIAPFALGYGSTTNAVTNDAVAGVIVLALAVARHVFTGRRLRLSRA